MVPALNVWSRAPRPGGAQMEGGWRVGECRSPTSRYAYVKILSFPVLRKRIECADDGYRKLVRTNYHSLRRYRRSSQSILRLN